MGCERRHLARDAIVEACAERDEQIALLHRGHRGVVAVHARHAQRKRMIVGECAARHQRGDHVHVDQLGELAQRLGPARFQDATAGVDHGARRAHDELGRRAHLVEVGLGLRLVAGQVHFGRLVPFHRRRRVSRIDDVLGDVDEHRARPPGRRDVERFANRLRDVLRRGHQEVVLGDGHRDAGGVALLERIGADRRRRHLTGDHDHGDRIHHRVAQRRDDVGRRRPTGHHRHAGATGRVGEPFGHVARALLVAHEDVADRRVEDRVVDGEDGAARQAEHDLHTLELEALDEGLAPVELHDVLFGWIREKHSDVGQRRA